MTKRKRVIDNAVIGRLAGEIFQSQLAALVASGAIDVRNKTREQIYAEAWPVMVDTWQGKEHTVMVDHRGTLIKSARAFTTEGLTELSCLLYATWFEHWINRVLAVKLQRDHHFSEAEVYSVIRSNAEPKMTWILKLVGLPRLKRDHINTLKQLLDMRNSFVHYKWKGFNIEEGNESEKSTRELVQRFQPVKAYLERYERRNIFHGLPAPPRRDETDKNFDWLAGLANAADSQQQKENPDDKQKNASG